MLLVLTVVTLTTASAGLDVAATHEALSSRTRARGVGGYLVVLGAGSGAVWIVSWAGHVFAGAALPLGADAFRVVAALDLTVLVPVLLSGGTLLWLHRPWGCVLAAGAGVRGTGYLGRGSRPVAVVVAALGQGDAVAVRCRAVVLRVPAVETGVAPFRPVGHVVTRRVHEVGAVEDVLARPGSRVAVVGGGVAPVGGGPDLPGGTSPLGMGGITCLDRGLARLDRVLARLDGVLTACEIGLARSGAGIRCLSDTIARPVL